MISAAFVRWEEWVAPSGVDGELLAVQRGDRDAFGALMARYQNRLYRYLLRWVRESAAAEDLFQQTWLRVLEHIARFDRKRNFDAWLFAIARNLAIDHLRRYRPDSLEEPSDSELPLVDRCPATAPAALEELMRAERDALVQRALEAQPAVYREILSLRFEDEMKLEDIAGLLAIPPSTVKSRLARALERLRRSFLQLRLEDMTP